jgi:hypothetical protein
MSELIVPGASRPRKGPITLYVPAEYADDGARRNGQPLIGHCLVPTDDKGGTCGARFYRGEEQRWQKHVGECARKHMDVIEVLRERERLSIFHEDQWDPEAAAYLREVGSQMLREQRFELRPNERIVDG